MKIFQNVGEVVVKIEKKIRIHFNYVYSMTVVLLKFINAFMLEKSQYDTYEYTIELLCCIKA
jgi:hypothetical protein